MSNAPALAQAGLVVVEERAHVRQLWRHALVVGLIGGATLVVLTLARPNSASPGYRCCGRCRCSGRSAHTCGARDDRRRADPLVAASGGHLATFIGSMGVLAATSLSGVAVGALLTGASASSVLSRTSVLTVWRPARPG
jgi:hypothetical protein